MKTTKKIPQLAIFLMAVLATNGAGSTVPQSINYQGYLTDRSGSPEVGDTLITFSIYNVEAGGSPLWSDTLNIDIENGLINIQLGRPVNPFPVDLFETPLWLGIAVEADNEMIPRRALTSVGFSFRAGDADSLQGKSAFDLDQSIHVDDLANPHAVTAAQAGAADQATLDAHTTDTGNPHQVTAGQAGATDAAVFAAHASDQAAHHTRLSDAEAVAAMGNEDASNPLNHARYSDGESVAAMLTADGPGSGLDADSVDGIDGVSLQSLVQNNANDIAANFQSRGVSVTSGGEFIGRMGSVADWLRPNVNFRWLPVISEAGRLFFVDTDLATEGQLQAHPVYYSGLSCTGTRYLSVSDSASEFAMRSGYVFRSSLDETLQVERDSVPPAPAAIATVLNKFTGLCQTGGNSGPVYVVQDNDPLVTGVPNSGFTPPIRIQ